MKSPLPPAPRPALRPRSLRPWYLLTTLLLAWIIGVRGLVGGCATASYLRSGTVPDVAAVAAGAQQQGDTLELTRLVIEAAYLRALSDFRRVTFPLTVARMLLGGLLLAASWMALGGKPKTRGFAIQVLLANMAFSALDYALTRGVRAAWIEEASRLGAMLPQTPENQELMSPAILWTIERIRFAVFELGALGAAAFALTRDRSKAYFEAVERAAEKSGEP